jgi:site-specific DNA-adenine methylase
MMNLKAPFPAFGGKSKIAPDVWNAFGNIANYVEPFANSAAMLLLRPDWKPCMLETINDADGLISNFWRSIKYAPEETASFADWPVNENDMHARHAWLVGQRETLTAKLEGDPDYYDPKAAGWWVWGMCIWIGGSFASGKGPWRVIDGELIDTKSGSGINHNRQDSDDAVQGIERRRPHLSSRQGINRKRPHLTGQYSIGKGIISKSDRIYEWFSALAHRLQDVRVCSGDWSRVCFPIVTVKQGLTAVFLDPPYSNLANRASTIYTVDSLDVAHEVREWAIENGNNKLMRIALCGYTGEHDEEMKAAGWKPFYWVTSGGYASLGNGNGRKNRAREVVWFSPHCVNEQIRMFS